MSDRTPGFSYGKFCYRGKNHTATRFIWELLHGPIPDALFVLHRCDNPKCVRPSHLFLGDHGDNMRDMVAKGRHRIWSSITPERVQRGEASPRSKLHEREVRVIRGLAAAGIARRKIAARFGVNHATVNAIVHRRKWAHVA